MWGSRHAQDEAEYAEAVRELASGILREGLWGKAFVDANGDKERAKVLYLKYRVALIKETKKQGDEERRRQETAAVAAAKAREAVALESTIAGAREREETALRILRQMSKKR